MWFVTRVAGPVRFLRKTDAADIAYGLDSRLCARVFVRVLNNDQAMKQQPTRPFPATRSALGALLTAVAIAASGPAHAQDISGKLRATGGVSTVEGSGGGGLATWALITGDSRRWMKPQARSQRGSSGAAKWAYTQILVSTKLASAIAFLPGGYLDSVHLRAFVI